MASDRLVIVDAMNVIGSTPNGWWRDRAGAQRRLLAQLVARADDGERLMVVFEGPALEGLGEGDHDGVEVRWARRRGRDAGDDRIIEEVALAQSAVAPVETPAVTVITADRALQERVIALGATVAGPSALALSAVPPRQEPRRD